MEPLIIRSSRFTRDDILTFARVQHENGAAIVQADIVAVHVTVVDRHESTDNVVAQFDVTAAEIVFDTYQLDGYWQGTDAPDQVGYNVALFLLRPFELFECMDGHVIVVQIELERANDDFNRKRGSLWVVHERTLIPLAAA